MLWTLRRRRERQCLFAAGVTTKWRRRHASGSADRSRRSPSGSCRFTCWTCTGYMVVRPQRRADTHDLLQEAPTLLTDRACASSQIAHASCRAIRHTSPDAPICVQPYSQMPGNRCRRCKAAVAPNIARAEPRERQACLMPNRGRREQNAVHSIRAPCRVGVPTGSAMMSSCRRGLA